MSTILTPRLRLEPFKNSHFEELYGLNSDAEVMQYITGRAVSLDETIDHLEMVKKQWKDLGFSSWSFFDRCTDAFVGTGGIQHIEFNPNNPLEMGWRLKADQRGHGYATEAARHMAHFIFELLNIDALYALCHQDNTRSERVMQRLGMEYCGIERWYNLDVSVYRLDREHCQQPQFLAGASADFADQLGQMKVQPAESRCTGKLAALADL